MASIYDLSWSETSFLAKLQLFLKSRKQEKEKMRSNDRWVQARGYSALSSTYCSIVDTALSQLNVAFRPKWIAPARIMAWCLTWLPLAAWCYWRMLPLSNRVVKLVGYRGMSADQFCVRQSVLCRRGRYDEAKECVRIALAKNPEKAHTRGLLHVGLAEIYRHKGDWYNARDEVRTAIAEAMKAEKQSPRQAARIYRHCADITDFVEQATGAKDQLLKL